MRAFAVVINDCAAPPVPGILAIRTQDTPHGERNFSLRLDDVAAGLPAQLTDREMDWLEILGSLFAVDMACERGLGDVDWNRSIDVWIPVRDPDFWDTHRPLFEAIWTELTADDLRITFEVNADPLPAPRMAREAFNAHSGVALLSGGQDSFAGALDLLNDGVRPLLLSHTASGATNSAQIEVEGVLKSIDPGIQRIRMGAGRTPSKPFPGSESSQRSRTIFFTGVAALLAHAGGSNRVFLNENGIMAIHVPLTPARAGSLSTHTASPPVVARMEALARTALEGTVTIENRLVGLTKPEVVARAVELGHGDEMALTVSCWQIGRTRTHCGFCAPCIMRRISCELHNVDDVDYDVDVFEDPGSLDDAKARDNLTHFISLVLDLEELSDTELEYEYPELLSGSPAMTLKETIMLHRKWATEASTVLFSHSVPAGLR